MMDIILVKRISILIIILVKKRIIGFPFIMLKRICVLIIILVKKKIIVAFPFMMMKRICPGEEKNFFCYSTQSKFSGAHIFHGLNKLMPFSNSAWIFLSGDGHCLIGEVTFSELVLLINNRWHSNYGKKPIQFKLVHLRFDFIDLTLVFLFEN